MSDSTVRTAWHFSFIYSQIYLRLPLTEISSDLKNETNMEVPETAVPRLAENDYYSGQTMLITPFITTLQGLEILLLLTTVYSSILLLYCEL